MKAEDEPVAQAKVEAGSQQDGSNIFPVRALKNILLSSLGILALVAIYLFAFHGFSSFSEPINFSSLPLGIVNDDDEPYISPYGFANDSLAPAIKQIGWKKERALVLHINSGPDAWCGLTLSMADSVPRDAELIVKWHGDGEVYRILVDVSSIDPDRKDSNVGTNYYVYLDAPSKYESSISIPLRELKLNPAQPPGAVANGKFNPANIRGVSFTFFPNTKALLQIDDVRFVWKASGWGSILWIAPIFLLGIIFWWRTTPKNILLEENFDLRSSLVYSRIAYIFFAFSMVIAMMSPESDFFSPASLAVYGVLVIFILFGEFFKDFLSGKVLWTWRYGLVLAVGWYLNFTRDPIQWILLLAIAFLPIVLYRSRSLFISVPIIALVVLITHPGIDVRNTILPGAVIISSLTFLSIFAREILVRGEAEREALYATSLYAEILEKTSDAIIISKLDGMIERVNSGFESITGYKSNEVVGRPVVDFVHPDDVNMVRREHSADEKWKSRKYDLRLTSKDGESHFALVREAPIYRNGYPVGYQVVATDISDRKRSEEALRESEERFRSLYENSTVGIYRTTPDGRVLMLNPTAMRMLGYSSFDEVAKINLETTHYDPTYRRSYFRKLMESQGTISGFESTWTKMDGSTVRMRESARAIHDEKGNIIYYDGIFEDITEKRKVEEALRKSEETLERITDSIEDIMYSVDANTLEFTYLSPAFERLLGYTTDDILKMGGRESFLSQVIQGSRSPRQNAVLRTSPAKKVMTIPPEESWWRCKDGSLVALEDRATPVYDDDRLVGTYGVLRNVTERKRAVEALQKSEEQYRLLVENLSEVVYTLDVDGKITYVSPAVERLSAHTMGDLKGKYFDSLVHPDDLPEVHVNFDRAFAGDHVVSEFRIIDKIGAVHWVRNSSHLQFEDGQVTGLAGILSDITENKKLLGQFVQAQKMESIGTLASGVAHDFNNILGIVMGHAVLLQNTFEKNDRRLVNIKSLIKAAERGASLIRQMLTSAQKSEITLASISVNDLVGEIQKLIRETFPRTTLIVCNLSKSLPKITADSTQLHQVLLNLCLNARDAMSGHGTLSITTKLVSGETLRSKFHDAAFDRYVQIDVTDTGSGMSAETLQHIFEPFFTTKEKGKGTGLGLSVVFGIMQHHKGFVDVQSQIGHGASFYLYFPVGLPTEEEIEKAEPEEDGAYDGQETILFIEDEEMLRELTATYLSSRGYKVLAASDGQQGVEVYRDHKQEISIVLSDYGLPKMSGLDVLKKIKDMNPDVKFLLATGYVGPDERAELFENGVGEIIMKPYVLADLLKKVRGAIDR